LIFFENAKSAEAIFLKFVTNILSRNISCR
jgi:hypothetical protein